MQKPYLLNAQREQLNQYVLCMYLVFMKEVSELFRTININKKYLYSSLILFKVTGRNQVWFFLIKSHWKTLGTFVTVRKILFLHCTVNLKNFPPSPISLRKVCVAKGQLCVCPKVTNLFHDSVDQPCNVKLGAVRCGVEKSLSFVCKKICRQSPSCVQKTKFLALNCCR